ncbi:Transcriptional regulator, contains XRE-family HTH domain [Prauserella aidingensis]|nr:Transcriptional regulator, contains XRE-family HTH domain [Prauserella aidingensis]
MTGESDGVGGRDDGLDGDRDDRPGAGAGDDDAAGPMDRMADLGRDIGSYIRQQRSSAKISLRQLSKLAGVSNPYLSQIERGVRKPSAEILQQIAKGLRISAEALYVQAGILDLPDGGPVLDAIRADTELSERQKTVLLDVYESFRRQNREESTPGTEPEQPHAEE